MVTEDDTLLEFPCSFPIKAMGDACVEFEATVVGIVREHAPDLGEAAIQTRASRNGRFVSVTCTITATSKQQLDSIYYALTEHPLVKMAL